MFCEKCGQQFLPKESVCGRCRAAPTRQWLQLVGLATLTIGVVCNFFSTLSLLPRLATTHRPGPFRGWIELNHALSLYGWVIAALAVLVWSFWLRRDFAIQRKEWLARLLLTLLLLVGIASVAPSGKRDGFASGIQAALHSHPGLGPTLAWILVILVVGPLCMDSETRDSLLGHGRVLSLVGLGTLLLVMAMSLMAWSIAH